MPSTVRTVPDASEPIPLTENVTVAVLCSLKVIVPDPLTVAVVDEDDGFEMDTPPEACHWLKRYPEGIVPVESEYDPAGLDTEPP